MSGACGRPREGIPNINYADWLGASRKHRRTLKSRLNQPEGNSQSSDNPRRARFVKLILDGVPLRSGSAATEVRGIHAHNIDIFSAKVSRPLACFLFGIDARRVYALAGARTARPKLVRCQVPQEVSACGQRVQSPISLCGSIEISNEFLFSGSTAFCG